MEIGSSWAPWGCLVAGAVLVKSATSHRRRLARYAHAKAAGEASPAAIPQVGRATFLRGLGNVAAGSLVMPMGPSSAQAKSFEEAKAALATFGLTGLALNEPPPNGWKCVVEPIGLANDAYYGRFKLGAEPQVVSFAIPPLWVVSKPNIDYNGAAGTVQANDYGKGDSATLFVDTSFKGSLDKLTKQDFQEELKKALTTKGKAFIEDMKVSKVSDGEPGYKIVEYSYEIESAAGFSINRNGIASMCQVGSSGNLQMFWTGVVTPRWGAMQDDLTTIAKTFRIGLVPKSVIVEKRDFTRQDEKASVV